MDETRDESEKHAAESTTDADANPACPLGDEASSPEYASRDQLRAMAHPLRLEIMERVGRLGTARAADLAAELGIPANSVSYHLRILARGGVIEEAPEAARDRRDRVWRLTQLSYRAGNVDRTIAGGMTETDPEYFAASDATSLAVFDWMRTAWSAAIGRHSSGEPSAETGPGGLFATSVRLTAAEMREVNRAVSEILVEAKDRRRDDSGADLPDPDGGDSLRTYRVLWASVDQPSPVRHSGTE